MLAAFFVLLFFPLALASEELESGFAKSSLFSLFGYSPLISGEEKELRSLHGQAETHVRKKEYLQAEKSYEEILRRIDPPFLETTKYKVDWMTYVDLILRLSEAKYTLKSYGEGEKLLNNLIATHPPQEYLPPIHFLLARFLAIQNQSGESFVKMQEVKAILPFDKWRGEDRSFFHGIEYLLNDHFDKLLKKARRFSLAHNTSDAIKMYEEILHQIDAGHYPKAPCGSLTHKKVRYRLAELYYQEACFEKTLALVEGTDKPNDPIDGEMLYLAAVAYREKREYEKAIDCFDRYLASAGKEEQEHHNHALLEIGVNHFKKGQLAAAKETLEKITDQKGKIHTIATCYLCKIALQEQKGGYALETLNALIPLVAKEDPLRYEIAYLKGEALFQLGHVAQACEFFESITSPGHAHKEWTNCALYQLALCYLKLAEKEERYYPLAEKVLEQLLAKGPDEKLLLQLARLYQMQHQEHKIEPLFAQMGSYLTREGEAESLLLIAATKKTPQERNRLYTQATSERFSTCKIYPECWYWRGLNDFNEGHYTDASDAFEKAFSLFEKNDQKMACHLLQCGSMVNLYRNLPGEALKQLEKVLNDFPVSPDKKEEVLYLQGLVSSHLASSGDQEAASRAANILGRIRGRWKDQALFALGLLHYRQKQYALAFETFDLLKNQAVASPIAAHALFWQGESAEKEGKDPSLVLACRQKCYEHYPFSSPAPHAYFKCFPFEKYLEGDEKAVAHIKLFPSLFPSSPFLTIAYYLGALHEKEPSLARLGFEKALLAYDLTGGSAKENKTLLLYFKTKALFELAGQISEEEGTSDFLGKLIPQLEYSHEALKKEEALHDQLEEENRFILAKCYLKNGQEKKGEELLSSLLKEYHERGVKEGLRLACVLIEQGKLAMRHGDLKAASECLSMAGICGEGYLPTDEKLNLWLHQSECLKKENKLDLAMKKLSKVINEEVFSTVRDKAMFMRAQIYELEGRHELAIRQLEASVKRGGFWGKKAKERLKEEYGME